MPAKVTMLDLVSTVSDFARSENELIATVVHMVNSGSVVLCGNFRGARFDLAAFSAPAPAGVAA